MASSVNGASTLIGTGGYLDAAGTPTNPLVGEIEFADAAIGQMVHALKSQGLLDQTLIIITAKHGQSPVDSSRAIPGLPLRAR